MAEKLKKMKQKFEVFRKAGKLFEEEKMRLHFKETTKVRRDTTLQILTALKEPAMRYANRQPSATTPGDFCDCCRMGSFVANLDLRCSLN